MLLAGSPSYAQREAPDAAERADQASAGVVDRLIVDETGLDGSFEWTATFRHDPLEPQRGIEIDADVTDVFTPWRRNSG